MTAAAPMSAPGSAVPSSPQAIAPGPVAAPSPMAASRARARPFAFALAPGLAFSTSPTSPRRACPDLGAGTQPRDQADNRARFDDAALEMRERLDANPILEAQPGAEKHYGPDMDVPPKHRIGREADGLRCDERGAVQDRLPPGAIPACGLGRRQIHAVAPEALGAERPAVASMEPAEADAGSRRERAVARDGAESARGRGSRRGLGGSYGADPRRRHERRRIEATLSLAPREIADAAYHAGRAERVDRPAAG